MPHTLPPPIYDFSKYTQGKEPRHNDLSTAITNWLISDKKTWYKWLGESQDEELTIEILKGIHVTPNESLHHFTFGVNKTAYHAYTKLSISHYNILIDTDTGNKKQQTIQHLSITKITEQIATATRSSVINKNPWTKKL